jgi:hypothetical protein
MRNDQQLRQSKVFFAFYKSEGSLTCSHEIVIGLYPEPAASSSQFTTLASF